MTDILDRELKKGSAELLILALVVALVQGTVPLIGASRNDDRLMALGRTAALTQAFLVVLRDDAGTNLEFQSPSRFRLASSLACSLASTSSAGLDTPVRW